MDDWLLLQSGNIIYIALFLLLLGGAIGLPIPEDLPLITAGILVQAGKVELGLTALVCYLAVILGDLLIYLIGRRFGTALFKSKWFRARVPLSRIKNVRFKLEKRSILMIFIARHLFYLRTATFLACGAVRMDMRKFLAADAAAALISMPIMIGLGYVAAEHYDTVWRWIHHFKFLTVILGILALGGYLYYRARKGHEADKQEQASQDPTSPSTD